MIIVGGTRRTRSYLYRRDRVETSFLFSVSVLNHDGNIEFWKDSTIGKIRNWKNNLYLTLDALLTTPRVSPPTALAPRAGEGTRTSRTEPRTALARARRNKRYPRGVAIRTRRVDRKTTERTARMCVGGLLLCSVTTLRLHLRESSRL